MAKYTFKNITDHPKYIYGVNLLHQILARETPSRATIRNLYSSDVEKPIAEQVEYYYKKKGFEPRQPRIHLSKPKTSILDARERLGTDPNYNRIRSSIEKRSPPDMADLEKIFGGYASYAAKLLEAYIHEDYRDKLKRRCGVLNAAHVFRVAGVAYKQGLGEDSVIAALAHDSEEDLLGIVNNKKGKPYGLAGILDFEKDFLPEQVTPQVRILTNYYDLISKDLKRTFHKTKKVFPSYNQVKKRLESLEKKNIPPVQGKIRNLENLLLENVDVIDREDVIRSLKTLAYMDLYASELLTTSVDLDKQELIVVKAGDLLDNAHGMDMLPIENRVKNIRKQANFALKALCLDLDVKTHDAVLELYESSLRMAEAEFFSVMLGDDSYQDRFAASLAMLRMGLEDCFVEMHYDSLKSMLPSK